MLDEVDVCSPIESMTDLEKSYSSLPNQYFLDSTLMTGYEEKSSKILSDKILLDYSYGDRVHIQKDQEMVADDDQDPSLETRTRVLKRDGLRKGSCLAPSAPSKRQPGQQDSLIPITDVI
ncbi:hypothetical protein Tco_0066970 [Tanacetum coccineum]